MIGELKEEDRNAVSNSRTRSVLPGSGIGTIEESTIARANSPTPPRWISHPRNPDELFPASADVLKDALWSAFHKAIPRAGIDVLVRLNGAPGAARVHARLRHPPDRMQH